jgi:hypothetical protein
MQPARAGDGDLNFSSDHSRSDSLNFIPLHTSMQAARSLTRRLQGQWPGATPHHDNPMKWHILEYVGTFERLVPCALVHVLDINNFP